MQDALAAAPPVRRRSHQAFAALFQLSVAEALRRGRTADGIEVKPLRQVLFASTTLGLLCALPMRDQEPAYWIRMLFLDTAIYTGLGILPDSTEAFERRRDILGALPIRRLDAVRARLAFLGMLIALLVLPLALPSLVWMGIRGDYHPLRLLGFLVAMLLLGLSMTGSWLYFAFRLGQRIGVDRVRRIASFVLSGLMAVAGIVGALSSLGSASWPPGLGADALAALPSSWFAAPLVGAANGYAAAATLGALGLLVGAIVLAARTDPTLAYVVDRRTAKRPRDGWTASVLAVLERRRGATRHGLLPLLLFLSRAWSRDPFTLLRVRAFAVTTVVLLGLGWWKEDALVLPISAAVLGFMMLTDGTFDLAMCSDAAAVWLLQSSPIRSERMVAAMRATVLCGRAALPAVVLGLIVAHADGATAGLTITVAFLGVGYLMVSALQVLRPRAPLAEQASAARGSTAIWLAGPIAMAAMIALGPAFLLVQLPSGIDVVAGVIFAGTLYAFGRVLGIFAARRYERRRGG